MNKIIIFILLSGLLVSCHEMTAYKSPVADDRQYFAIGNDGDGCMRYRIKPTSQMSVQVIVYKTIDGSYTPNKENSVCY